MGKSAKSVVSQGNSKKHEKVADMTAKKEGLNDIDAIFSAKKRTTSTNSTSPKKKMRKGGALEKQGKGESTTSKRIHPSSQSEWVNDGLGGKFNGEGYTGRVEDGVKIFKAHVFNKPNFGSGEQYRWYKKWCQSLTC